MFKDAYTQGKRYAASLAKTVQYTLVEDLIFIAMENNPYKSEKTKKAFFDGVSEWVNMLGRIENRQRNETPASLKYWNN